MRKLGVAVHALEWNLRVTVRTGIRLVEIVRARLLTLS